MLLLACEKVNSHGLSEVTLLKTIESDTSLIVVWLSKKAVKFSNGKPQLAKAMFTEWRQFLDTIYIRNKNAAPQNRLQHEKNLVTRQYLQSRNPNAQQTNAGKNFPI